MKKLVLTVLFGGFLLGATIGCDSKPTTAPAKATPPPSGGAAPAPK